MAVCAFCLVQLKVPPDDATFSFFSSLLSLSPSYFFLLASVLYTLTHANCDSGMYMSVELIWQHGKSTFALPSFPKEMF